MGHAEEVSSARFSPDGKQILTGSGDHTMRLWNVATGKVVRTFTGHESPVLALAISPDGKQAISGSSDDTLRLWDVATGKEIRQLGKHKTWVTAVAFSPDGKFVATGSRTSEERVGDSASGEDKWARLWDVETGKEEQRFKGHLEGIRSVAFSPDGTKLLTGSDDKTARVWDVATGKELCALVSFTGGDWAVVDPQGRFDASQAGNVEGLHWVVNNEAISLAQLKERYYEPGLLAKKMGLNTEKLRDVQAFSDPKLFPTVSAKPPEPDRPKLDIDVANQGGGIGRVVVKINGKELTADARPTGQDPNAGKSTLEVPLPPDHPLLIPGQANKIEIEAYNAEGYLRSRGLEFDYQAPAGAPVEPPQLWAILVGVSDYRGESLKLRFAAKDAEDLGKAVRVAGSRLFGAERVHLTLLSSSGTDEKQQPTRENLVCALEAAREAKPADVLFIYLAGHGVTFGGQDGDFYFLSADARGADLSDPGVREHDALSSQEITELIKRIPAMKQVLILDTCASGKLIEKLTEKRDVPTSQVRALDRLKDRTGMHVLAGCASDAVSYEATRYGQGVLTYSLRLGMQGAALREDQFVDVSTLFAFTADNVPLLARDVGGIQRPVIAVPKGGSSFDIGQLTTEDRAKIPLQAARPLVLRSLFHEKVSFDDVLDLNKRVDDLLRNSAVRGKQEAVVFVDARDLPGSYRLAGEYQIAKDKVTLAVNMFQDKKQVHQFTLAGQADKPDELAKRVVETVEKYLGGKAK